MRIFKQYMCAMLNHTDVYHQDLVLQHLDNLWYAMSLEERQLAETHLSPLINYIQDRKSN